MSGARSCVVGLESKRAVAGQDDEQPNCSRHEGTPVAHRKPTQIKDPKRNDGRDMAALVKYMAEDSLVGWAWSPGANRTPAPGSQKEFGDLIKAWAAAGAACPKIIANTRG